MFCVIAILFPFSAVALVNGILAWADFGVETSLVVSNDRIAPGEFYLNPHCDLAYCTSDLRGPEPRTFRLPKNEQTLRVLVVGASSVQGYPHPSELAFPRQMQLVLDRQLPERTVEVLNVGVVGLSTTPLVDLVSQSIDASPDVIVLYAGHNEFYGVGGVATNARMSRLGVGVRRFRLGQILTSYFAPDDPASGELITRLPSDIAIPIDSTLVTKAEEQYRKNLGAIAETCSRNNVALLICGVMSNLRDHSPLPSPAPPSLGHADKKKLDELEIQATQLMGREQYADAVEPLLAARKLAPDRAETSYWLAQCLDHSGRASEASDCYARARDLDGCRYRAPGSFHQIAQQVAAGKANAGIHFVDLIPAFSQASQGGVPGHDMFLEHVHFTLEGHWLVAGTIARAIVERVRGESWDEGTTPSAEERDRWLGVINEDHIVAGKLASFLLERPPFNGTLDVQRQLRSLTARVERYSESLSPQEMQVFSSLDPKTSIDDLVDGLGRVYLSNGDIDLALAYFERGMRRRPWMPNSFVFAGICHHLLGDDDEAMLNVDSSSHTPMSETEPLLIDREELLRRIRP